MEQLTFYHLLSDITLEEVFQAYFDCRRHKRHSMAALKFEANYEQNLINLWQDITAHTYHIAPSNAFIVRHPVLREVFAANFRDRIVHHLVIGKLLRLFENVFYEHSYSCRAGKGTLFGIRSVYEMLQACSNHFTQDCFVLRLDIQGFFFHIDKTILFNKIQTLVNTHYHHTNKEQILYLLKEILSDNPIRHCNYQTPIEDWAELPQSKSLFFANTNCGLPIGNLTSQIFANFYLNDFDYYATSLDANLFYARYVDDLIFIHPDKDFLHRVKQQITDYLKSELHLTIHPKKVSLQHYAKGFSFTGAYILPNRIYPSKRLQKTFYQRIERLNQEWKQPMSHKSKTILIEKTRSTLNSYFGILRHFNCWRVKLKAWNMLCSEIREVFSADMNFTKVSVDPILNNKLKLKKQQRLTSFARPDIKRKNRHNKKNICHTANKY
ncbi:MAG: RNA-directed DNA polymerase [Alphaproteobacteria bacterium]|nr:RNA-directed DNA polymerase [Alphaproteobacteria bacterium]